MHVHTICDSMRRKNQGGRESEARVGGLRRNCLGVCVRAYSCIYVCVHTCMHTHANTHMRVASSRARKYSFTWALACTYTWAQNMHTRVRRHATSTHKSLRYPWKGYIFHVFVCVYALMCDNIHILRHTAASQVQIDGKACQVAHGQAVWADQEGDAGPRPHQGPLRIARNLQERRGAHVSLASIDFVCTCMHAWMYVHVYSCIHAYVQTCMSTHINVHACLKHTYKHINTPTCMRRTCHTRACSLHDSASQASQRET